ncbi:hypothetical protein HDV03_002973 [Kappamyces sp. JEL0829]|nr:hypothetical protein HDV03_002973 [Kappamyces sp. JEL0829]
MTKRPLLTASTSLVEHLEQMADSAYVKRQKGYFKEHYTTTEFMGLRVPQLREIALQWTDSITLPMVQELMKDKRHEVRFSLLEVLIAKYKKAADEAARSSIVDVYLSDQVLRYVTNWDLVDASCGSILGAWLYETALPDLLRFERFQDLDDGMQQLQSLPPWYRSLFQSSDLWQVRISIVSLLHLLKKQPAPTLPVFFLVRLHLWRMSQTNYTLQMHGAVFEDWDLIHKAIGWVLRETGKIDKKGLIQILDHDMERMAKVTVSYCTERLGDSLKTKYRNRSKAVHANRKAGQ